MSRSAAAHVSTVNGAQIGTLPAIRRGGDGFRNHRVHWNRRVDCALNAGGGRNDANPTAAASTAARLRWPATTPATADSSAATILNASDSTGVGLPAKPTRPTSRATRLPVRTPRTRDTPRAVVPAVRAEHIARPRSDRSARAPARARSSRDRESSHRAVGRRSAPRRTSKGRSCRRRSPSRQSRAIRL